MRVTEELRTEHENIVVALNILEQICKNAESGLSFPSQDVDYLLEFFSVYADMCHQEKEELVLFPAMESIGFSQEVSHMAALLLEYQMDHQMDREIINHMDDCVARIKDYNTIVLPVFIKNAHEYIDLLKPHITRENTELFKIADEKIPKKQHPALLKGFKKVEKEKIGAKKYIEFHTSLYLFRDKYAKIATNNTHVL